MSQQRGFGVRAANWLPTTTLSWMGVAFLIAFVIAGIVVTFGTGERGTSIALRATARWSFLLFWLAYVGGAAARLCERCFNSGGRHGRDFGLSFASAHLIHVGARALA